MRTLIIGCGAMGSLFGALLTEAGGDVLLIDNHAERAAAVNRGGLRVEGIGGERSVRARAIVLGEPPDFAPELALVCVKSYSTAAAAEDIKSYLGADTPVLTMQNGVGNVELLQAALGADRVVAGTTSHGATVLGHGHIRHAGRGDTFIGEPMGSVSDRVRRIAETFNAAGINTDVSDNVTGLLWGKLLINVGINPLTGLLQVRNGRLVEIPDADALLEDAVAEAMAVARAAGVRIEFPDPIAKVRDVARLTAQNISSMRADVMNKKQTEIDYICGAIVRAGEQAGIPTPINTTLMRLVRALGAKKEDE